MSSTALVAILIIMGALNYLLQGRRIRSYALRLGKIKKGKKSLTRYYSRPRYYSYCALLWTLVSSLLVYGLLAYGLHKPMMASLISLLVAAFSVFVSFRLLRPRFNARQHIDRFVRMTFLFSAIVTITITVMIVSSILFESLRFFDQVPLTEFLFGRHWSPQGEGSFGAVPVFLGTLLITLIALAVAAPIGLLSAIYLSEYASTRFRTIAKPLIEVLAGIPTVVYGYFAVVAFAPALRQAGLSFNLAISPESALAAGIVMGIMIIPFVMSLSDDVIKAVPYRMREASLGLGATQSETIRKVLLPAALPGIVSALLLAVSRAVGETMIVVMAAGLAANLSFNPFESVTTVTVQIVTMLVGDQEFDSAKTLSAFALSLYLFVITLMLNLIAMIIVKKFREKYE